MSKGTLWKALFGKEADKLEQASDDDKTYYIIEKEPIITRYISVPKDKVGYILVRVVPFSYPIL